MKAGADVDVVNDESFRRVVGKRARPALGQPPSKAARDALTKMAGYRTGAPKGVFRYRSHEDANRDREAWTIAAAARCAAREEENRDRDDTARDLG